MFHLRIKTDNDAFQEGNKTAELIRILKEQVIPKLEAGEDISALRDINGNTCGSFRLTKRC